MPDCVFKSKKKKKPSIVYLFRVMCLVCVVTSVCTYMLQVAPSLTDCFPTAGPGNLLYIFVVHEVGSGRIYMSLPGEASHTALGILIRKPLPHLKVECCMYFVLCYI